MSTIASDDNTSGNLQFAEIPTQEELNKQVREAQQQPARSEAPAPDPVTGERPDWLPPKFKDPKEFRQSYEELESTLGRQAQEIGSLRQLTNELVASRQTYDYYDDGDSQQVPDLSADDVLNDPRGSIGRVVQEEIKRALAPVNDSVASLEASLTMGEFSRRHPTFQDDQNSPEFAAWLQEDRLRKQFAAAALNQANSGDLSGVDDLFSEWEQHRAKAPAQSEEPTSQERAAELAASAIAPSGGMGGTAPKQYVRRSDLDHIMMNDRDRYDSPAFQQWMQDKYSKGLVK